MLSPDPEPARALIVGFPASGTVKNKFLLFLSYPIYNIIVIAARMD